jgi:cobaltochelatase CobN
LCESDLLSAKDYADHIGGFNAAVTDIQKVKPKLYHLDISFDGKPRVRSTNQELARIIRGKLSDDRWVSGMMDHGYRGAAEITDLVFNMSNFGKSGVTLPNHLIDMVFNATLANTKVADFLAKENKDALVGLENTFSELRELGLWKSYHNSIRHEERLIENG